MRATAVFRVRYLVTALVTVSSCVSYMNRTHLNIAIVEMVDNEHKSIDHDNGTTPAFGKYCKRTEVTTGGHEQQNSSDSRHGQRFKWSDSMQGTILGSFYYSYVVFQMPTGILTEKYGGKWIIVLCLMGSGVVSLLTPVVASLSAGGLIGLRVVLGVIQAGMFPAGFGLLCHWMPVRERSTAFALLNAGGTIGSSVPDFVSGPLIHRYGWPSLFYVLGLVSIATSVLFALLIQSKPEDHSFLSEKELREIREDSDSTPANDKSDIPIPWTRILTNPSVLSVAFFQFCTFWILTILSTSLPLYLDQVLGFDISSNGVVNGVLQWLQVISLSTSGFVSEIIIAKKWLSRTRTRKLFSLLTGSAAGLCVLFVPVAGCDAMGLIALIFVGSFLCGFTSGSDVPVPSEMTDNFPAAVFAFLNMVSTASGFVTPAVVDGILQAMDDKWRGWSVVFYLSGGLMIAANAIFLLFVSAERQSFDFPGR